MKLKWDKWFYGMFQAVIGGAAASGSAYIAMLIGNQVTATIPVMNWQTLGFVLLTSSMTNLFFYLRQSPLPPPDETTMFSKQQTRESKQNEKDNTSSGS